ncbi:MAG: phosphohydrolase [Methylocapsa sp.]|nr:phosphohydrolase [Methylocapsa sp.]
MTIRRAWVRLPSGKRLDLLNPTPFDWEDEDLALGLARTYRWGGHSAWSLPLSVAQHSLLVLALYRERRKSNANAPAALRELLHDADEGLLGFDCIAPVKPFLGEAYRTLAGRLEAAIAMRYRLAPWTVPEKKAHRQADRLAAASEAVLVAGWAQKEVRQTLGIPFAALSSDPLQQIYGGTAWEPWPPEVSASRFLAELTRLQRSCARALGRGLSQ